MRTDDGHLSERDLLRALDGELTPRRQAAADAHLTRCAECQTARARLARVSALAAAVCRQEPDGKGDRHARGTLQRALAAKAAEPPVRWGMARALVVGAAVGMLALAGLAARPFDRGLSERGAAGALPVALLTPGATWNVTAAELCAPAARPLRPVPAAVRQTVLHGYRMERVAPDEYELDYLITPELGGAPDARNIWPQRYGSRVWNAHVKDHLEHLLPQMVCAGQVPLATAQREIAADWIAAYQKYFRTDHPLPQHTRLDAGADGDDMTYPVWRAGGGPALELIAFSASR